MLYSRQENNSFADEEPETGEVQYLNKSHKQNLIK